MTTESQPDSVSYGLDDEYIGEARTKPEVSGYWILESGWWRDSPAWGCSSPGGPARTRTRGGRVPDLPAGASAPVAAALGGLRKFGPDTATEIQA